MVTDISVHYRLYAEDLKLFYEIELLVDCRQWQMNIRNINKWSHSYQLLLNANKCSEMMQLSSLVMSKIEYDCIIWNSVYNNKDFVN